MSFLIRAFNILFIERRLPYRVVKIISEFKIRYILLRFKKRIFLIPFSNAVGDTLVLSPISRVLKKKNNSAVIYVGCNVDMARRITDFDYVLNNAYSIFDILSKEFNLKNIVRLPDDDFKKFNKNLIEVQWQKISPEAIEDRTIRYKLMKKEEDFAERFKEKHEDYLIFAPFCAPWSKKKRWLDIYWQELVNLQTLPVVIIGSDQHLLLKNCIDLRNKTTVHQMAALIKHCGLFVGLPSGPLWFANIFEKEAIVINGGYELPILTQYAKSHHFFIDIKCSLCNVEPRAECGHDMECMKRVTPEIVNSKIKELLNAS